ncbi:conoCAP-like [Littorina saxatilis]|uniref:Uncharacterized protein n=1 Tax=Littorina saxatilis TaxID=31220 RepID=A0AAN9BRU9_9CAEN
MVSRGHVLYCLLLPLLAQVAAEAEEQIIAEVMSRSHEASDSSRSSGSSDRHLLPNPLPPSLLLQLLHSGALQLQQQHNDDANNGDYSSSEDTEDDANMAAEEMPKRVFCNGFTGCGGRHRDRSRRQEIYGKRLIPVLVKRPFCNSFGCYNGKRSSIAAFPVTNGGPAARTFRARTMARALGIAGDEEERAPRVPGKRLFCNGYGGCRGGKRSLYSPWLKQMNSVAEGRR